MTPGSVNSSNTRIYTDAPVAVSLHENGLVNLSSPCNVLLNRAATFLEMPSIGEATVLSVRWALNGQRLFESGSRRFAVDDSSYRIFNFGSEFRSCINSPIPVDCYTVCFQPETVDSAIAAATLPTEKLLDEPSVTPSSHSDMRFMEKTSSHDQLVSPILRSLTFHRDTPLASHGWFEEQFLQLLGALLRAESQVPDEIGRIAAARPATREELYRRIHGARDFMEAGLFRPLTVAEIACESAFSPFHFLRIFKQYFGETPHQYLTRRRLEAARVMLQKSTMPVCEICSVLGFESTGSFSWLFRRHVGVSPEKYRLDRQYHISWPGLMEARQAS